MNQDPVIAALEQQVDCYRKLARLAELQHVYVQQSQTEHLLQLLQSRQTVLDQIADLEQTIGPVKKRWTEFLTETTDPAVAQQLLTQTRTLLEEITTADRNDAMVLQQRKLNLGKQIGQAAAARQLNRNYATAAYGKRQSRMDLSH
jgi:chorismate mutase